MRILVATLGIALFALPAAASSTSPGPEAGWTAQMSRELVEREYDATSGILGIQAPNRAQGLRTYFLGDRIEISPRIGTSSSWRWSWRTRCWGRSDCLTAIAGTTPRADHAQVRYARPDFVEWYRNGPRGLEQGFDLSARPRGAGPLLIEADVPAGFSGVSTLDRRSVEFTAEDGTRALRYGDLHARDAAGRELAASIEVLGRTLRLTIDDRDACYPVAIDPLLTSPAWTVTVSQDSSVFGFASGTAGDVNGDGYSDVIVGAPFYDNGETDEGRAFLYLGSAAGLSTTPAWTGESNQAGARYGVAVASAGDVNGDGYGDVIVGANLYDDPLFDAGAAFVYLGSPSGLATSPAWTGSGHQSSAYFGVSVASAGDVNGDGYGDVIVGAEFYTQTLTHQGAAFVYLGSASGLATSPVATRYGDQPTAVFGHAVSGAGDVNGDGYDDVVVGEEYFDNAATDAGKAAIFGGGPGGISASPVWITVGDEDIGNYGSSVASAGDVNGDGYADVLVGARHYDNLHTRPAEGEGKAYLYYGSSSGPSTTPGWSYAGEHVADHMGHVVASAGDVNGDGYSDVLVSAFQWTHDQVNEGHVLVFLGSALGLRDTADWQGEGNSVRAGYGWSGGSAGDVNGDGYADVIVGEGGIEDGVLVRGRASVYYGSPAGLASAAGWSAAGSQAGAMLGAAIAYAGDVNGDGFSDVIVGAPGFDGAHPDGGRALLFAGSASGLGATPAWFADGDQDSAHFGAAIAGAHDVNGDGYDDVVIGAPEHDSLFTDEGRAVIYFGSATGLASVPGWTADGRQAGAGFGFAVAGAGDLNGDGFADLIVGSPRFDAGPLVDAGRFQVFLGSAAGPGPSPSVSAEGGQAGALYGFALASNPGGGSGLSNIAVGAPLWDGGAVDEGIVRFFSGVSSPAGIRSAGDFQCHQAGARLGSALASAGNVDGTGRTSLMMGAPGYSNGEAEEGRVYVLGTTLWTAESNQPGAHFGAAVAGAGDVNGDGFSEVAIGAPDFMGDSSGKGMAFVFTGGPAGLSATPAWTSEGSQAGEHLGSAVAIGGDVDGDGYSDLLVGSPDFDGGATDGGRVTLFQGNGGHGLDRASRQRRGDDTAPLALLGASGDGSVRIAANGRTPAGRGRVRLEVELKPLAAPFDGTGIASGLYTDTGRPAAGAGSRVALSKLFTGLNTGSDYHWRIRQATRAPAFPHGPWFTQGGSNLLEKAFVVGTDVEAVPRPVSRPISLEAPVPSPFHSSCAVAFTLDRAGWARLTVFDPQGRRIAVLADGAMPAGRHSVSWNGREDSGRLAPSGIYRVRLETSAGATSRPLVLTR